jgi:hypothetical protein
MELPHLTTLVRTSYMSHEIKNTQHGSCVDNQMKLVLKENSAWSTVSNEFDEIHLN